MERAHTGAGRQTMYVGGCAACGCLCLQPLLTICGMHAWGMPACMGHAWACIRYMVHGKTSIVNVMRCMLHAASLLLTDDEHACAQLAVQQHPVYAQLAPPTQQVCTHAACKSLMTSVSAAVHRCILRPSMQQSSSPWPRRHTDCGLLHALQPTPARCQEKLKRHVIYPKYVTAAQASPSSGWGAQRARFCSGLPEMGSSLTLLLQVSKRCWPCLIRVLKCRLDLRSRQRQRSQFGLLRQRTQALGLLWQTNYKEYAKCLSLTKMRIQRYICAGSKTCRQLDI